MGGMRKKGALSVRFTGEAIWATRLWLTEGGRHLQMSREQLPSSFPTQWLHLQATLQPMAAKGALWEVDRMSVTSGYLGA